MFWRLWRTIVLQSQLEVSSGTEPTQVSWQYSPVQVDPMGLPSGGAQLIMVGSQDPLTSVSVSPTG